MGDYVKMGRILVVDDNKGICALLKELFSMEGHDVETCSDIEMLYDRLASFSPDLGIFDIHVGRCDILKFTEKLKHKYSHMVTIFMSADEPDESFNGQHFIKKPFDIFKLKDYINKILNDKMMV